MATAESDLALELESVSRLTEALDVVPERILRRSYSDQVVGSDALVDAARAVMEHAHAPYSKFRVGAALRAEDGSIHVGANVENAAYPQGLCAEAAAIGALIAAGRKRITEAAVISDGGEHVRALRRLPPEPARVHGPHGRAPHVLARGRARDGDAGDAAAALVRPGVPRAVTAAQAIRAAAPGFAPRLGIVLGSGLGGLADTLEDPISIPYGELDGLPAARRRRPPGHSSCSARSTACRSPACRAASTSTRAATRARCAARCAR